MTSPVGLEENVFPATGGVNRLDARGTKRLGQGISREAAAIAKGQRGRVFGVSRGKPLIAEAQSRRGIGGSFKAAEQPLRPGVFAPLR